MGYFDAAGNWIEPELTESQKKIQQAKALIQNDDEFRFMPTAASAARNAAIKYEEPWQRAEKEYEDKVYGEHLEKDHRPRMTKAEQAFADEVAELEKSEQLAALEPPAPPKPKKKRRLKHVQINIPKELKKLTYMPSKKVSPQVSQACDAMAAIHAKAIAHLK